MRSISGHFILFLHMTIKNCASKILMIQKLTKPVIIFPFPAPLSKHSCLLGGWQVGQAVEAIGVFQAAVVAIQFIETRGREGMGT